MAVLGLVLSAPLPASAAGDGTGHDGAATASSAAAPAARLIRIGPQALVRQDEHGKLTMVEELQPEPRNRDVVPAVLGVLFTGIAEAVVNALPGDIGAPHPILQVAPRAGSQ